MEMVLGILGAIISLIGCYIALIKFLQDQQNDLVKRITSTTQEKVELKQSLDELKDEQKELRQMFIQLNSKFVSFVQQNTKEHGEVKEQLVQIKSELESLKRERR